jgi:hypothetical protein
MRTRKKRPPFNLKSRITSALRRIWLYSPTRRAVSSLAKVRGNFCAECGKRQAKLDIDHVDSVVGVEGFVDWNTYIDRMFNAELVAICRDCHNIKTAEMRDARKAYKKKATKRKKR